MRVRFHRVNPLHVLALPRMSFDKKRKYDDYVEGDEAAARSVAWKNESESFGDASDGPDKRLNYEADLFNVKRQHMYRDEDGKLRYKSGYRESVEQVKRKHPKISTDLGEEVEQSAEGADPALSSHVDWFNDKLQERTQVCIYGVYGMCLVVCFLLF